MRSSRRSKSRCCCYPLCALSAAGASFVCYCSHFVSSHYLCHYLVGSYANGIYLKPPYFATMSVLDNISSSITIWIDYLRLIGVDMIYFICYMMIYQLIFLVITSSNRIYSQAIFNQHIRVLPIIFNMFHRSLTRIEQIYIIPLLQYNLRI